MRVLFASWTIAGHFAPLVPVGWALRAAGHEVLVACPPSGAESIVKSGLAALPVGPDVDLVTILRAKRAKETWPPSTPADRANDPEGYHRMLEPAEAVAEVLADDVVSYAKQWRPDLVVYEPTSLVGPLAARVLGVPAVRQLWTCDITAPVNGFPATIGGDLPNRFGLEAIDTAGDLTLDPCPPRLQVVDDLPRQPIRYVPYNGPAVLPDWLRAPKTRPRIAVSWGTTLHTLGLHRMWHVPLVVDALARLDVEIVVAVLDAHRELFTNPAPNVRHIGPVPLHLLLPTCDAIVHQGGGGTLMTAAVTGLPHIVVPTIVDQVFNASFVESSGIGRTVHVSGDTVAAELVRDTAADVLTDPAYRTAAASLRDECLAQPSPADVVRVLERLASRARSEVMS